MFGKKSTSFTNGSGVYVRCGDGHYLKAVVVDKGEGRTGVDLTKVMWNRGKTVDIFEGVKPWKRISESEFDKVTETARAEWQSWHEDIVLKYCFTCNEKRYFTMDNDKVPAGRWYAAQVVVDELSCGLSNADRMAYLDAVDEALNKGDLARVAVLNNEQRTRARIGLDIDLITAFASIMIIEEGEAVDNYDPAFNKRKINEWRANMGDTFFLSAPIRAILPFSSMSESDFMERLKMMEEMKQSGLLKAWLEKSRKEPTT